ncbi:MAG TPA: hypothetical protein VE641_07670 [Chthoniobacterales bacterium]|nr:hypothetical protein [Chthoniobacterales bacterium]
MTGKMALIDETDIVGNFTGSKLECAQKFLRFSHPGLFNSLLAQLGCLF